MERSVVAMSTNADFDIAFNEVAEKIKAECSSPKLIIFFCDGSALYTYSTKMHEAFSDSTTIGTTSYKTICSEGTGTGLSAMAINDGVECASGILFEIGNYPKHYIWHVYQAMEKLSSYENTCCLEFSTAFSNGEELVLDTFQEAFAGKNIPVFGGSSGPGCNEQNVTYVSLDGVCYKNTCVFVLIHNLEGKIVYLRENLYKATDKIFTVTDVDIDKRIIYELDNNPAADAVASALNVSLENLSNALSENPVGRLYGNELYITEPAQIMDDGSVSMFAQVFNNTRVVLMEQADIKETWNNTLEKARQQISKCSFGVLINCLARSMLFEKENLLEDFSTHLKDNYCSYIGLSGFGEQLNAIHMNQTMIFVLFE